MWNKQLLSSFGIFLVYGAIQIKADDSCIEVTPVENFDPSQYGGHFYAFGIQDDKSSNMACLQYILNTRQDDNTQSVIKFWKDLSDNSLHILFKNITLDETGRGDTTAGYTKTIVGTDYDKWAVVIGCDESENRRLVWVLTPTPEPMFTTLWGAYGVLQKYNIQLSDLRSVNQKSCPVDWSNAEKDEVDFTYDQVKKVIEAYGLIGGEA